MGLLRAPTLVALRKFVALARVFRDDRAEPSRHCQPRAFAARPTILVSAIF